MKSNVERRKMKLTLFDDTYIQKKKKRNRKKIKEKLRWGTFGKEY